MKTKRFVRKTLTNIIMLSAMMIVLLTFVQSPTITNEIALTQMDNSNEMFILMTAYYNLRPLVGVVITIVIISYIVMIARDICKFIKSIYKEKD